VFRPLYAPYTPRSFSFVLSPFFRRDQATGLSASPLLIYVQESI
jgi:hypothetical protein